MRKKLSLTAGLAAVGLALAVTIPANAVTGGTKATKVGPNVAVSSSAGHCSGTLINLSMVLTAWHCFKGSTTGTIRWGNTTWKNGKKVAISTVEHENDLALIHLNEDIPFDEVEYPSLGTADPKVGDTVQFFGFGVDDSGSVSPVLRTGSATVITPWGNGLGDAFGGPAWTIQNNGNGNIADGDSGGGAYLGGKLVGVASNGDDDGANLVSVAAHMPFLNQRIR